MNTNTIGGDRAALAKELRKNVRIMRDFLECLGIAAMISAAALFALVGCIVFD